MSAVTWQDVTAGGALVPGAKYRLRTYVGVPYTALNIQLLKLAFGAKLFGQNVHVDGYDHAPPVFSAHAGLSPFPFIVRFTATEPAPSQSGLDPRGLIALAGVIAVAGLAVYISGAKVERLLDSAGGQVNQALQTTLNPAVLILVVVGLYLYTRRG